MKYSRFLLSIFSLIVLPQFAGQGSPVPPFATYSFGLSLATGANNQIFTCFIVKVFEGKVVGTTPITSDQFVWQAQGVIPSEANPQGLDLFQVHDVPTCLAFTDSLGRRHGTYCDLLNDLWKLRFWEYPFHSLDGVAHGKGWAEEPERPSDRQMLLLSDYGFRYVGDLCYGDAMFRLLHDVGDPEWVDNYRKGY